MNFILGTIGFLADTIEEPALCRMRGHRKPLHLIHFGGKLTAVCGCCGDFFELRKKVIK